MQSTDFSDIKGIAQFSWELTTETALCIKSGTTSVLDKDKTIEFKRKNANGNKKEESLVSDFSFDAVIENNSVKPRFRIPASSIRGVLRNFTIRELIPQEFWGAALSATDEKAKDNLAGTIEPICLKQAFEHPGWQIVRNLFGLATDGSDPEVADKTVAGRLHVYSDDGIDTPDNPQKITLRTRNPLDRCIQAGKDKGLHQFMVLPAGNTFTVTFRTINPIPADLGLFGIWKQYINAGRIRLGGAGKARLSVKPETAMLYLRKNTSHENFPGARECQPEKPDLLEVMFDAYDITGFEKESAYRKAIEDLYTSLHAKKEAADA